MRARVQEISISIDKFLSVDEHGSSIERQDIWKISNSIHNFTATSLQPYITWSGETLLGEIFVGWNYSSGEIFVTKRKIRHFRRTKNFAQ